MSLRLPIRIGFLALPRAGYCQPCLHFHFFSTQAGPSKHTIRKIPWPATAPRPTKSIQAHPISLLRSLGISSQRSPKILISRAFSTSRSNSLRQTYFPNSGRPSGSTRSTWQRWRQTIDDYPPMFIVCSFPICYLWQCSIDLSLRSTG